MVLKRFVDFIHFRDYPRNFGFMFSCFTTRASGDILISFTHYLYWNWLQHKDKRHFLYPMYLIVIGHMAIITIIYNPKKGVYPKIYVIILDPYTVVSPLAIGIDSFKQDST